MSAIIYPTTTIGTPDPKDPKVFLAGSIEMGKAENWQSKLTTQLENLAVTFFNPRRTDWDSSWVQTKTDPQFSYQVNWELEHLAKASIVALYLAPDTISPISLLELGLYMQSGKLILCCPPGFNRKGNIDITAQYYNVPVHEDFENFADAIRQDIAVWAEVLTERCPNLSSKPMAYKRYNIGSDKEPRFNPNHDSSTSRKYRGDV